MHDSNDVTCCIAGGGPAGMMAGFLLARAGVDVLVLEKHRDFFRDFRGDTIHPSTLEVMHELGLLEAFLKLPHQEVRALTAIVGGLPVPMADFSHLPVKCPFIALMPQWDFLNFLAEQGKRYRTFGLRMETEATDLVWEGGRVAGIRAKGPGGALEIRSKLVIGAEGRHSILRERAGLAVEDLSAPMDVLWFSLSRKETDTQESMGRFESGYIFITINRGDHWQCGLVIPKGTIEDVRKNGLPAFRERVMQLSALGERRAEELQNWDQIKLLTVRVDRLRKWYLPGLLFIGDSAHAMSPIGGVGVNLAIQDAVAAANILAAPLKAGRAATNELALVQRRRMFPARVTQRLQVIMQNRIVRAVLFRSKGKLRPPFLLRLFGKYPVLRRLPARLIGMGIRPEHVRAAAELED